MSRHPSPGPSHSVPQIFPQAASAPSRRSRPSHSIGIAAGAEDVKYQGKYKDLKRKVKEIEGDNDRLHFKIQQAKRSLQRMKLERAILYERISSGSPPAEAPAPRSYSGRDTASRMEPPQVLPSPHMSAHNSAAHDTPRHLPPLPNLPPVGQYDSPARTHPHPPAASPPIHDRGNRSQRQQYPENLPPVQRVLHSPPPHADRDRTSRRIDANDYPPEPPHLQQHSRRSSQVSPHLHSADARSSSHRAHHRGLAPGPYSSREDSLPRQYDLEREKGREREYRGERERDTRGLHSPPHLAHRRADYPDYPHPHHPHSQQPLPPSHYPPHLRPGEEVYYHDSGNPYPSVHASRSDTPGSGSNGSGIDQGGPPGERAAGIPSRPDSRTQFYEDRNNTSAAGARPSYRLRPVSQSNNNNSATNHHQTEDVEFGGHDRDDALVRSQSHDARLSSSSTPGAPPGSTSGPNNGTSVSAGGGGAPGSQAGSGYPPPPPPPLGSGHSSHLHLSDRERHERHQYERGQTPTSRIESSAARKRSRNDMDMDIDSDILGNHNNNDIGSGVGRGDSGSGSRRNTPAPPGFSDERDRDRDRGSVKRYQRDYRDDREGSAPPPPSVASHPPPPAAAAAASSTQDHQEDTRTRGS